MAKLRLYQITDTLAKTKDRAVPGEYFSDQNVAKSRRRALNGNESNGQNLHYVVSPGPDHRNYKAA